MHCLRLNRGMTFIDTIVGSALMLIVFMGIAAAFQLTVDVVSNNKARAGAIALANERIEYIRSLSYDAVGTDGGIPAGDIPQIEELTFNATTYTRRVLISYADDAKDGLGVADTNDIITDYKQALVTVSWVSRGGLRTIRLVTRISPIGIETDAGGGTLTINVENATAQPVITSTVTIVNTTVVPNINITAYTDAAGKVSFIGAPAGPDYEISVSKAGYSSAQTYDRVAPNLNPNPGHLTVSESQTTSATFAIDLVGTLIYETYALGTTTPWSDPFSDSTKIATSSNIDVSGGRARYAGTDIGVASLETFTISPPQLITWEEFTWDDVTPSSTTIRYFVHHDSGGGTALVPDAVLPGNSAGFTTPPIDLSGVSTSTYPGLRLKSELSMDDTGASTPSIDSWGISYTGGPSLLTNVAFELTGAKTVGTGSGGSPIYKYQESQTSGPTGVVSLSDMEWDTYSFDASGSGYDLASACPQHPVYLAPGTTVTTRLYFAQHTTNSILVDVRTADGTAVEGATVRFFGGPSGAYDVTRTTDSCGQVLFDALNGGNGAGNAYSVTVTKTGYTTYNGTGINVNDNQTQSVILN